MNSLAVGLLLGISAFSARAWGPHSQITQAALDALGTNAALVVYLGGQAQRLTNYCWMPDYFGVIMEEPDDLFYADDYLLFPEAPRYFDHTGPDIRQAFRPFFNRAMQALRTENPANAARWIGALLHFVQDCGCPPHAAGLRGDVHSNMENWVDIAEIRIRGYQPVSLGKTEEQLWQSLLRLTADLMFQAEDRGRRLRVPVEIGNRSVVRPVVLESAITCARATADLLHTFGQFVPRGQPATLLRGAIASQAPIGMERFPAKVVLLDTPFSTLTDLSGRYEFRNLPASNYTVLAFRAGNGAAQTNVTVKPVTNLCNLTLPKASSLVLNGDFHQHWTRPTGPDYWTQTKSAWEGLPIPLRDGQRYRLTANFKEGARGSVLVRSTHSYDHAVPRYKIEPRFESRTLTATNREMVFTGSRQMGLVHITIRGRAQPSTACDSITLVPIKAEE